MYSFVDLQQLQQAAAADYPGRTIFCLADHGGMPGLHRELIRARIGWRSLFAGSSEEKAVDVAPLLFSLDEAVESRRHELLHWVAEHGTYTSSMLMLASPLDLDELARRLGSRLDAVVGDDIEVMLRFFDPRVFEALTGTLAPEQLEDFLGVADGWWFFDRSGASVAWPSHYLPADPFEAPVRLDDGQARALTAASEIDQVATQLQSLAPEPFRMVPLPQRAAFVGAQMAAAKGLGLVSVEDMALYGVVALVEGDGFAETPKWQDAIGAVRDGRSSFADAIAAIGA